MQLGFEYVWLPTAHTLQTAYGPQTSLNTGCKTLRSQINAGEFIMQINNAQAAFLIGICTRLENTAELGATERE